MLEENLLSAQSSQSPREELVQQEEIITKGRGSFERVREALAAIRKQELYRPIYKNFNQYTKDRWDMTRRQADYLIGAASVMAVLRAENFSSLPTCETQVRHLTSLSMKDQVAVWREALATAVDSKLTAANVRKAASSYRTSEEAVRPQLAVTKDEKRIMQAFDILDKYNTGQIRELVFSIKGEQRGLSEKAKKLIQTLQFLELDLPVAE